MTNIEQTEIIAEKMKAVRKARGTDNKMVELQKLTDEESRKHEPPDTERRTESWRGAW